VFILSRALSIKSPAPWSPLHKKGKIKVSEGYVVYIGEPQEEIVEEYKTMFGKISTPTKKLII